jgi:hypothetical protein
MALLRKDPPQPVHVTGTQKGEELVHRKGREPGRHDKGSRGYRTARDSTGINADGRDPIDPRMPYMPPA